MCGICGIVASSADAQVSADVLGKMNSRLKHRGPDDQGTFIRNQVGLAHSRLSIIDLAGGQQPMFSEDRQVALVYNGEIYNYLSLKEELEKKQHRFQTHSDTETIVHLYEQEGEECLNRLRGAFAFAIWDEKEQKLFGARDRFGIKPFYYTVFNGKLYFSSELKSFLEIPDFPREVEFKALDFFLRFQFVPAPLTFLQNVYRLPAAHCLSFQKGELKLRQYWDLDYTNKLTGSAAELEEGFSQLLEESVKCRLMSEVPLGAYLSGGIDSSVVVGLMSQHLDRVKTFSVGFAQTTDNHTELEYARKIARHFNTDHHEYIVEPGDLKDLLFKVVSHFDEPVGDMAAFPSYLLSELAKQHVTVVLTGEGADELLGGYGVYQKVLQSAEGVQYGALLPSSLKKQVFALGKKLIPASWRSSSSLASLKAQMQPHAQHYFGFSFLLSEAERRNLYNAEYQAQAADSEALELTKKYYFSPTVSDTLDRMLYLDTKLWLAEDLLMKVDKMTMAWSVEARVPYLDHHFAEYVARLPREQKIQGGVSKYILKKTMQHVIPEEILKRPKHGFTVPIDHWLMNNLTDFIDELFNDPNLRIKKFFNQQQLISLWDRCRAGEDLARQIWSLVSVEIWYRIFIEGEQSL